MSSKMLSAEKAWIFRIMHRDNLPRFLEYGCLSRNSASEKAYVEIGNQELIQRRNGREIPCAPYGTLADYVPFYFTPYSPMLYNIKTGYNVPQQPMSNILIMLSSLHSLANNGLQFIYSDRHAYLRTAKFTSDIGELNDRIAWSALQSRDFSKSDVDRSEKYQAEALVYKQVSHSAMLAVMCHDDSVKAEVQAACSAAKVDLKVINGRSWYL